jgi:S-adenosylmethionine synthetase
VACETLITRGFVVVAGEVKTTARLDIPEIVRATIAEIGYTDRASGFNLNACRIEDVIGEQAPEIVDAVEHLDGEIGAGDPLSLMVDLHGGGRVEEARLAKAVREIFPLTPKGIIETLDLRRPIYKKTAAYGHFGRELPEFTWERRDRAVSLKAYFGL